MSASSGRIFLVPFTYLHERFLFMLLEVFDAAEPISRCPRRGAYANFSVYMTWFYMSTESVSEDLLSSSNHRSLAQGLLAAEDNTCSISSNILKESVMKNSLDRKSMAHRAKDLCIIVALTKTQSQSQSDSRSRFFQAFVGSPIRLRNV